MPARARWILGIGLVLVAVAATFLARGMRPGDAVSASRGDGASSDEDGASGAAALPSPRLARLRRALPEPGARVLLLGLDGLDWDLVLPRVEAGEMPNLGHLLQRGTWGDLKSLSPMLSPLIWTTVATGVSPEVHGILDFVEYEPRTGRLIPVTSRSRRVPALWNMASALGRRVDVVGWWGTWPAEEIAGTMVSDRLYYTLAQRRDGAGEPRDLTGIVSPQGRASVFAALRRRAVRETGWEEVREFMEISRATFDRAAANADGMADPVDGFRRILASTRTYLESGLQLSKEKSDLLMVYLEGTDTIGHLLARYVAPSIATDVPARQAAIYAAAVPRYFAHVDQWLGRYLDICPLDECVWVVVSDHGFKWGEDRPRGLATAADPTAAMETTAPLWHDERGVFVVAGPGIPARGRHADVVSVYDVAPTVAALLGLPPEAGWRGDPLPGVEAGTEKALDYTALLSTRPETATPTGDDVASDEALAKLEALGYLQGTSVEEEEVAVTSSSTLSRRELNNLGLLQLDEGRLKEAEATLRRAIVLHPQHPYSYVNLNLVLLEQQRFDEADRVLWQAVESWSAVEDGWREPSALLVAVAKSYVERGEPARATALLERGIRERPRDLMLWLELLTLRTRFHECDVGLEESRRAAALFPQTARVHGLYGLMALCGSEAEEARRAIHRSLELDPDQPVLRRALDGLE